MDVSFEMSELGWRITMEDENRKQIIDGGFEIIFIFESLDRQNRMKRLANICFGMFLCN
jgi:hypothetical protein